MEGRQAAGFGARAAATLRRLTADAQAGAPYQVLVCWALTGGSLQGTHTGNIVQNCAHRAYTWIVLRSLRPCTQECHILHCSAPCGTPVLLHVALQPTVPAPCVCCPPHGTLSCSLHARPLVKRCLISAAVTAAAGSTRLCILGSIHELPNHATLYIALVPIGRTCRARRVPSRSSPKFATQSVAASGRLFSPWAPARRLSGGPKRLVSAEHGI